MNYRFNTQDDLFDLMIGLSISWCIRLAFFIIGLGIGLQMISNIVKPYVHEYLWRDSVAKCEHYAAITDNEAWDFKECLRHLEVLDRVVPPPAI